MIPVLTVDDGVNHGSWTLEWDVLNSDDNAAKRKVAESERYLPNPPEPVLIMADRVRVRVGLPYFSIPFYN